MDLSQEVIARADFLKDVFPCLEYGRRVIDSGAAPIAYDVKLLRELLARREAELHAHLYDALVVDYNGSAGTKQLALLRNANEADIGYSSPGITSILERFAKGLVAGEDPRETVVKMVEEAIAFDPETATEEDT